MSDQDHTLPFQECQESVSRFKMVRKHWYSRCQDVSGCVREVLAGVNKCQRNDNRCQEGVGTYQNFV